MSASAVGAHRLDHTVDEPHEVDLVLRHPQAVGLGCELVANHLGVRILRFETGQHGVVAGCAVGLTLLHRDQAVSDVGLCQDHQVAVLAALVLSQQVDVGAALWRTHGRLAALRSPMLLKPEPTSPAPADHQQLEYA